jgi:hypothetical protein
MGRDRKSLAVPLTIIGLAIFLPPLYAGSLGPAAWLASRNYLSVEVFHRIYGPLWWLASFVPELEGALVNYCRWCTA